jgi:hypothetical protein
MSQIARAVQYHDTGVRKERLLKLSPLFEQMVEVKSAVNDIRTPYIYRTYQIQLKLSNQFTINEYELVQAKDDIPLTQAVKRAKVQMIEAVFGEFRPHIRRIEQAIYDYRMEEAGRLLQEMERQMFEPGDE